MFLFSIIFLYLFPTLRYEHNSSLVTIIYLKKQDLNEKNIQKHMPKRAKGKQSGVHFFI